MTRICCPFDSTPSAGGLALGGTAYVDIPSDPWDGMICVQPLDETSTGDVGEFVDRTRNHFDGQGGKVLADGEEPDPTTYPTIDEGVFCLPSQHFDGRQLISLEQDNLTGNHEFTVSLWAKIEPYYKSRTFYSRGFNDGAGNEYVLSFGHSFLNTLSVSVHIVEDDGPPAEVLYFGSTSLDLGVWYHAAVTYGSNTLKLYVNGVLVGTKVLTGDLINLENGCFLGATDYTSNLTGNIQEFRLRPVAHSANWLLAEYDSFCEYFVTEGEPEALLYG